MKLYIVKYELILYWATEILVYYDIDNTLLLNHHRITEYRAIRFSNKSQRDIIHAIQDFCVLFGCNSDELCFHEDNPEVIDTLHRYGVTVMQDGLLLSA